MANQNERFEDTYSFISRLQKIKMQESDMKEGKEKSPEIKHTVPKQVDGKGKTKPSKMNPKKKVDKPKNAKVKAPKDPNIVEDKTTKDVKDTEINESILGLGAIEKIMKADANGKDGAIGALDFLKSVTGGKMDPQIQGYIDMLYALVTGKKSDKE